MSETVMTSEESHGRSIPAEVVEILRELLPEPGYRSYEELLRVQECALQSFQIHDREGGGTPTPGRSSDLSPLLVQEGESLRNSSLDSARDEDLARLLAVLGDDFDDSQISEIFGIIAGSSREIPARTSETPATAGSPDVRQDEVSPDEMSHEECALQSFQIHDREGGGTPTPGRSSDLSLLLVQEGESLRSSSLDSQLARDEALAKLWAELGDDIDDSQISEIFGNTAISSRENPASLSETPVTAGSPDVRQDEVIPDEMSHEQLQSLGDSIATEGEGTGLPEEFISNLISFAYQPKNEECVICKENYEQGDKMSILPCSHKYHTECIKPWLMHNKTCPVCKEEVRDY